MQDFPAEASMAHIKLREDEVRRKTVINSDESWFATAQTVTEIASLANNRMLKRFVNFLLVFVLFIPV